MNERLRLVLPYLRPRSGEITWYAIAVLGLLALGLVLVLAFYFYRRRQQRQQRQAAFFKQAQQLGLKPNHSRFLWQRAVHNKMNDPLLLLSSPYIFDRQIGPFLIQLAQRLPKDGRLAIAQSIRALLGYNQVEPEHPLSSTWQLEPGQTLLLGIDKPSPNSAWVLVQQDMAGLHLAPLLGSNDQSMAKLEPGRRLKAQLWRNDDTAYYFASKLLSRKLDGREPVYVIAHSARLKRVHKRNYFRLQVQLPLTFFGLSQAPTATQSAIIDDSSPLEGQVVDLSAGGLGAIIADPIPDEGWLCIDPNYHGRFPLAGLCCRILRRNSMSKGKKIECQFVDLTPAQERSLVGQIYQYQAELIQAEVEAASAASERV